MKTNSKILIYDDACPLCAAYTSVFVSTGLLNKDGRKAFTNIDEKYLDLVDSSRCNNEIPLIDIDTKKVWYGIDALLEILGSKCLAIKKIGSIAPVNWSLKKLYSLISYNRKVIVAVAPKSNAYDCAPAFSMPYRIYFLFIFLCFNSIMLLPLYNKIFSNSFVGNSSFVQLQSAHLVLVCLNIVTAFSLKRKAALEYIGQINMLALITILLLLPFYFVNSIFHVSNSLLNNLYMLFVGVIVAKEYLRRMKYASVLGINKFIPTLNLLSLVALIIYLGWC